jgi:hypothetical protein
MAQLQEDMETGQLNALLANDQECWEVFSRGAQKLYNGDVFIFTDTLWLDDTSAAAGLWWPEYPNQIGIWSGAFETPTDRVVTMAHESVHDLMGPANFDWEALYEGASDDVAEATAASCAHYAFGS